MNALEKARYLGLTTYRRSGKPVTTTVWFATVDGSFYVRADPDSGKVKRLRHTPRVMVMASSGLGKTRGPAIAAQAHVVVDLREREQAERALRRKYAIVYRGWFGGWEVIARLQRKPRGIPTYPAISPI